MHRTLLPCITACLVLSCARAETAVADVLISDEQEAQLGQQFHDELAKENVKYLNDAVVTGYVQGIVNKLEPQARQERNVALKLFVIDDPKTVNAFATPGGYLYVYTGLLLAADNEAEVAGVMGHEIGHVIGRHIAR